MVLHFVESGKLERGKGPAVVLLHAFPMDSLLWVGQRKAVAAAGHLVVTPDLPGFGGSARADGEPSLDVYADEVVHLLDHLAQPQVVLGGLSMGGYVAMNVLRRYPERVAALVLADTKASADPAPAREARLAMAAELVAGKAMGELPRTMPTSLLGESTRAGNPALVGTVGRWISAQDPFAVAYAQRAMAARPDSTQVVQEFAGPVLVIRGAQDALSSAADAATMLAGGAGPRQLAEIPAAGHLSAIEAPEAVSEALISWLRGLA